MQLVFKYLLGYLQEKGFVEEQILNVDETSLFYKKVGRQTDLHTTNGTSIDENVVIEVSWELNPVFPPGA